MPVVALVWAFAVGSLPLPALAHTVLSTPVETAWNWEPWLVTILIASIALYALGLVRLWRKAGTGRGITVKQAAAFAAGWLMLVATLVSPLDTLGAQLFSAHMVQHEVMMVVAAPLLVVSRPLATWAWALPRSWRRQVRIAAAPACVGALWRWLTAPLVAWALHALVLWLWHAPPLFEAALARRGVHALQHLSFFASALLFWWVLLGRRRALCGAGPALGYLFTTMIHTGALGALLTIASQPWYGAYEAMSAAWGLSPLEDQQLGGLIMWVPAGGVYAGVGLALVAKWLSEERSNVRPGLGEVIT